MGVRVRIVHFSGSLGGFPKRAGPSAGVTPLGIKGDGQRDREDHGGPDRALCVFSRERIRMLQAEGHPIAPGTIGENVTVEGIDWTRVTPGSCRTLIGSR